MPRVRATPGRGSGSGMPPGVPAPPWHGVAVAYAGRRRQLLPLPCTHEGNLAWLQHAYSRGSAARYEDVRLAVLQAPYSNAVGPLQIPYSSPPAECTRHERM
jgi:hypothetical protein